MKVFLKKYPATIFMSLTAIILFTLCFLACFVAYPQYHQGKEISTSFSNNDFYFQITSSTSPVDFLLTNNQEFSIKEITGKNNEFTIHESAKKRGINVITLIANPNSKYVRQKGSPNLYIYSKDIFILKEAFYPEFKLYYLFLFFLTVSSLAISIMMDKESFSKKPKKPRKPLK